MNEFLDSLSNIGSSAADLLSAAKGNLKPQKTTATTTPTWVWYLGGGAVALVLLVLLMRD